MASRRLGAVLTVVAAIAAGIGGHGRAAVAGGPAAECAALDLRAAVELSEARRREVGGNRLAYVFELIGIGRDLCRRGAGEEATAYYREALRELALLATPR